MVNQPHYKTPDQVNAEIAAEAKLHKQCNMDLAIATNKGDCLLAAMREVVKDMKAQGVTKSKAHELYHAYLMAQRAIREYKKGVA